MLFYSWDNNRRWFFKETTPFFDPKWKQKENEKKKPDERDLFTTSRRFSYYFYFYICSGTYRAVSYPSFACHSPPAIHPLTFINLNERTEKKYAIATRLMNA